MLQLAGHRLHGRVGAEAVGRGEEVEQGQLVHPAGRPAAERGRLGEEPPGQQRTEETGAAADEEVFAPICRLRSVDDVITHRRRRVGHAAAVARPARSGTKTPVDPGLRRTGLSARRALLDHGSGHAGKGFAMCRSTVRLICLAVFLGLISIGLPGVAVAQARSLTVAPESGPAGSRVTVTGANWSPEYYASGVTISFHQNHGNGVYTSYAEPIVVRPDPQGGFSFESTIPAFFRAGDLVTFSGLIGNGSGQNANFRVTEGGGTGGGGPATVTIGKTYAADKAWAESVRFDQMDVVRYQVVLTASADTVVDVRVEVVGPGGRSIFAGGGEVRVPPSAGSVFFESSIPVDALAGDYTQTATVVHNGVKTVRTSTFSVAPFASAAPPEWLTNLTEQDLFNCTVTLTSLAAGIVRAPNTSMPATIEAIEALSLAGDYEVFARTLASDSYWNGVLKATGNVFYEQFRACFMGTQSAMQATSGAAGRMVGEWLRSVVARRG